MLDKENFNRVMIESNRKKNIVIEGIEYFTSNKDPYMTKSFQAVWLNEDSTDIEDLEYTIESLLDRIEEEISDKERDVLISALVSFFTRNTSLEEIQLSKAFYFYEYPIRLIQNDSWERSLGKSYAAYTDEEDLLFQVLTFVVKHGLRRVLYEQVDVFPYAQVATKVLNILNINEHLSDHLFSFQLTPTTKDRVLMNTKYIDIKETESLLHKNEEVNGLYTSRKHEKNIQYEKHMNPLFTMQVLIHELLHAAIDVNGVDFVELCKRHEDDSDAVEEEVVHFMGHSFASFIMDNPDFVLHLLDNYATANIPTEEESLNMRSYDEAKSVVSYLAKEVADSKERIAKVQLEIMRHERETEQEKRESEKIEEEKK